MEDWETLYSSFRQPCENFSKSEQCQTLYVSLKQWIPTISLEDARTFIAEKVHILTEDGREIFFNIVDLYCKEHNSKNDWFVESEQKEDCIVYVCNAETLPEQLSFILFKFVQKSFEMTL
jgi:hypothetical protein